MKRLALFAHYDHQNHVKRYVKHMLSYLRRECDQITFISTSQLPASEVGGLRPWCSEVHLKDNVGLDFGMWKHGLERTDLSAWDEILLVNSSVFGPLWPLGPAFDKMTDSPNDFWGMTSSVELDWHLQSYFLLFKRRVFESDAFRKFWDTVLPYANKRQIIRSYEIGLSVHMIESGFRAEALVPIESLAQPKLWKGRLKPVPVKSNPTCSEPCLLLERGMPFVKVELLRDNPRKIPLAPVLRAIRAARYDLDLIEFDRQLERPKSLMEMFHDVLTKGKLRAAII